MIDDASLANFWGFTVITLLFLVACTILIAHNRTIGRNARIVFVVSCLALFFITLVDWFNFSHGADLPSLWWLQAISTAITFSIAPAIPITIAQTIFPERHIKWLYFMLALHALFELVSLFGGYVFWVDATNTYHRGPLYIVYMLSYIVAAAYLSVESIRAGTTYQSVNTFSIIAILGVMFVGVGIQVNNGTIRTTWPSVAMAVFLYFQFYTDMILRTDALTKLLNRHSYEEFLKHPPLPCAVIVVDVNDFKQINDTYGHDFGDICLTTIGTLLKRAYGSSGLCYRTGGDEFMVVLSKNIDKVDSLNATMKQLMVKERAKDERKPGVSIGYAVSGHDSDDIGELIKIADQRMYAKKREKKVGRI